MGVLQAQTDAHGTGDVCMVVLPESGPERVDLALGEPQQLQHAGAAGA